MKYTISVLLLWWVVLTTLAQEAKKPVHQLSGYWRNYYMATLNADSLGDFQALATGGLLKYEATPGKRISLGAGLYTSINTGIQDLTRPDPVTGKLSRYELGLFDVENPARRAIFLPGELYIRAKLGSHQLSLGRMKLVTPFINPQDGRMIPTLEEGIWYQRNQQNSQLQAGIITRIAARSTARFYPIGRSIGTYPVGRTVDGKPASYAGNTQSDFVAVLGGTRGFTSGKIEAWAYYTHNLFAMTYLKPSLTLGSTGHSLSAEWMRQSRAGQGGSEWDSLRYFEQKKANVLGGQWQWKKGSHQLQVGYDFITGQGRFLFPREWGREPLFSFQKRERSEGSALNHALVFAYDRSAKFDENTLNTQLSIGYHWKAPVGSAALNKYAMPDYAQLNVDVFYVSKKRPNWKPEFLCTYKWAAEELPVNPNLYFNKADMWHINMIVNYQF